MQYVMDTCPQTSAVLVLTPFDSQVETFDHSNTSDDLEEAEERS
jgi:hypothetical protein